MSPRSDLVEAGWRALVVSLALAAGCAVGPDFRAPPPPAVTQYDRLPTPLATSVADGSRQELNFGAPVPGAWWEEFGSGALDAIVTGALAHNAGLEAAQASLRQSEDYLRAGEGVFWPQGGVAYGGSRQRVPGAKLGESGPTAALYTLYTLSGTVGYTLDVFGGQRRTVEALGAATEQARQGARAAGLALAGNVVDAVIASAAYREELDALSRIVDLEGQAVHLAQVQATAGTDTYAHALSLRSELAATEALRPQLEQKRDQADHLLAMLSGRLPAEANGPLPGFAEICLPRSLPVAIPSRLVEQRPDILVAEAQVHTASAEIGVATAAMLPTFSLTASYGGASLASGALLSGPAQAWAVGGQAAAPLFQGGALRFRRRAAIEGYQQALALYRQTVDAAFEQVADTLRALQHDAEALEAENQARADAEGALRLAKANYQAGTAAFADLLVAEIQFRQSVIDEAQVRALRYQDTVALFVALGGGWGPGAGSSP